jgi:hypothetical protein
MKFMDYLKKQKANAISALENYGYITKGNKTIKSFPFCNRYICKQGNIEYSTDSLNEALIFLYN